MARYDKFGALDDAIGTDGDYGFVGFNNRLRPDQLQRGMLADSRNIRLDRNGEAQVRKGVELVLAPLAVGGDALTLPFDLPTVGEEGDGITAILDDDAVNAIYGSCAYSNPNDVTGQYIVIASNAKAIAINVADSTTTDIAYPAGLFVSQNVDMIQAFNKVFIFRNGKTALEWDGDLTGTPAFTKVASGAYSQPKQLSPTKVDIVNGKATATFSNLAAMNGLGVGDRFIVETVGSPSTFTVDTEYMVAARDDTAFTIDFFVQLANQSNISGVVFQQQVSVGLGFSHMPAPPFATYHQRRLVMPYRFEVDNAVDSFTSRGILDEVIASDILDTDTYDRIYAQYRFNAGTADYVVGLHSFAEDSLLVFNRNSIHLVQNTINLEAASTRLLTNEVGCVARKSIVQVGNQVIFLSDNGVYGTQFLDEYNLRGTETPLSEPINETIKRINKEAWEQAVAVYFDNRYYIAVPLDGATENNAILVYNFLNQQWESVDTVADANYYSTNLLVLGEGNNRGIYAINDIGGVHKLDNRVDGVDRVITQIGGSQLQPNIGASITTRQYTIGTMERKKWKEYELHIQSSDDNTSDLSIQVETENPDAVTSLGDLSTLNGSALAIGEDVSIRGRIGNRRGYGIQFTLNNTTGRPRIRAIEVDGSATFRSTNKAI
jgi:hypothetical protein